MRKVKRIAFSEYIKELPSSIVFTHLVKESKKERKIISSDLIETITGEFVSEKSLISRFTMLPYESKRICALTYLFGSSGLKAIGYEDFHEIIISSFLIYSAYDKVGTDYYLGFKDSEEILSQPVASFLYECAHVEASPQSTPFLRMRCLNDFIVVLIMALKGSLKEKKEGGFIRASVTELKKLLHTTAESCLFEKKEQDITSIIQLLLTYGVNRGYLTTEDKCYISTHEQVTQWLSHSYQELYEDFVNFAVEYSGAWSIEIVNKMLNIAGNSWLSTSVFPVSCRNQALTMLRILHYIGVIEAVSQGDDILWRRVSFHMDFSDSDTRQNVSILPDYSAILPQEVLPEVLYAFSLLGTFSNLDRVYKCFVDRSTVNESLSKGIDGDVLISHLSEWETPVNVIETVKEWIREFLRLCVISANTVVTFDEKTSRQVSAYQPLSSIIIPLDAHTVFTIKKGREKEARDILTAMGFDPRVPELHAQKPFSAEHFLMENAEEELTLSPDFQMTSKSISRSLSSGKYSEELKVLEVNELFHVIDYAILVGHYLKIEYEGSPYIKQGMYTIIPEKLINGVEPCVEGKTEESEVSKKYYIKKIKRIGVKSL